MGPSLVESANQCCRSRIFRCGSRSTYFVMMPIRILAPRLGLYLDPNPEPGGKLSNKKSFCKSCKTKNSNFFCKCFGKSWEINESWMTIKCCFFILTFALSLLLPYVTDPESGQNTKNQVCQTHQWGLVLTGSKSAALCSWLGPNPQHCSWLGPNPQHCSRLDPSPQRRGDYFGASERDLTGLRFRLPV